MDASRTPRLPVDLVIPYLNEAQALPAVLAAVPAHWGVVVVDNGSTDDTAAVARRLGARVVEEPHPGYGAAVDRGLRAAVADLVVVLDGDGSIRPGDVAGLVAEVAAGRADLACGARRPVDPAAWPVHSRWGNRLLAGVLRGTLRLDLHDIAPVRVARRTALLDLGVADRRFGYPLETLLRARAAGWRIVEHPVAYHPRGGGRSKVTGSVRGTAKALLDFARVLLRSRDLLRSGERRDWGERRWSGERLRSGERRGSGEQLRAGDRLGSGERLRSTGPGRSGEQRGGQR